MKINSDNSNLLISGNKAIAKIDNNHIEPKDIHVLLGITTDSKLTFENYMNKLCKKANQKLYPLARIYNYTTFDKRMDAPQQKSR